MKRLYAVAAIATTLLAFSCQKHMGTGSGEPQEPSSAVPADFKWETTRDLDISVGMPSVTGSAPQYAVIRVYSSPILSDGNVVAMGVVTPSRPVFETAVTIPAGIGNIYVQTTLPDGTVAVSMEPVAASVNVAGAQMKAAAGTPSLRMAGMTRAAADSSMPDYPRLAAKAEGDFAEGAIIRNTPAGKIDLGASWAPFAAAEYYIPAGAEVTGNISLNGTFSPNPSPILYVAGKLTLDASVTIGQATLAVLPGGEVYIREASANMQQNAPNPAIFVFEGGKFTTGKTNFSCKAVVNEGKFIVEGTFDINNSCAFYNGATAELEADDMEITNRAKLYNDGKIESDDLELNSYAELSNCENGIVNVDGTFYVTNQSVTFQKGVATMDKLEAHGGGTLYVNCHTVAEEIAAEGARFYIASGAGLDAGTVYFNSNTELYAAAGAIFTMDEYNAHKSGGNVRIVSQAASDQLMAVVMIREKGVSSRYYGTKFDGLMEVVYDNAADAKYVIDESSLTGGAVFGRANILTEFDVVWEEGEGGQHLVVYEHHMEESAPSDDEASANADRIRGPRLKLIDSSEVPSIESVSLDGRLLTWSQGGCLVDAAKFELACMKWYSGPMGAGANAKAVALFRYLERARPELASDEAEICPLFGYPVAAFREAEDEEMAQAGGADCGEGGFDEVD